ncbi:MAG: S1 RNA-binding domain-containing protein [Candidatus Improbicoccus pseudotrichonymphae]|uniref:S1 RNA-binding domain-containing protein n=1 Tax=Candidatus Improbicoccus pseudotrichonymphae TaxID=3033792 RepID=A0AA48I7K8_9FIRM|nr:MAG: S1 RNA-binding domain-containing protein [Candidatus Improbicoccus pseudotrichonymphae]
MNNYYPEGYLIKTKENKNILSSSYENLIEAKEKRTIIEAKAIVCDVEHNLIVDMLCIKGKIPRKEGAMGIQEGTTRDIAIISRVNKPVCFVITDLKQNKNGKIEAILSRRLAQELCFENMISKLDSGNIIKAKITHIENFGVFADIGCGIVSFLPIDAISISRISHPNERFKIGDDINVIVKSVIGDRINLSHKELLGTWEENAKLFNMGETVSGITRSIENYGIFIELTPNLAGLAEFREGIHQGQPVSVYIKNIIPEKMKIKLVIIEIFDEKQEIKPLNYFFKGNKIERFVYSPENCTRIIETDFTKVEAKLN